MFDSEQVLYILNISKWILNGLWLIIDKIDSFLSLASLLAI